VTLTTTGEQWVKATDTVGGENGQQSNITVQPAAPDHLVFIQQPSNVVENAVITPAITVELRDQYNNLCTNDNTTNVTIAIENNPSGGVLSGTFVRQSSAGVATFNDLSIDKAGVGYTLKVTSGILMPATSNAFNIMTAGVATWTGAVSTDWNTPGNWDIGVVPSASTSVIIPSAPLNQPVLSSAVEIYRLTVDSGATLSTANNDVTVNENISLGGTINAASSSLRVKGNFISTGGTVLGANPTLNVDGYAGTQASPINTNINGTLTVIVGGMSNLTSVSLSGTGNYSYWGSIPGFVFMNGRLVPHAGQASIRSTLETGESVAYKRNLAMPQPLMAPLVIAAPISIMIASPAGVVPVTITPAPVLPLPVGPVPARPLPVVPRVLPPPVPIAVIPARVLFEEARVSSTVSGISVPQTFEKIKVYANPPAFLYFRDAEIASYISRIAPPSVFNNVKVFLQIH
jgi:hypothetical protein